MKGVTWGEEGYKKLRGGYKGLQGMTGGNKG